MQDLSDKLAEIENRFNAAKVRADSLEQQASEAKDELLRVQGEFRAVKAMREDQEKAQDQMKAELAELESANATPKDSLNHPKAKEAVSGK